MADAPWLGDACSLVDAFRAGELSPVEATDASLAAIESSELSCFSFVDSDGARAAAERADVSLPFGGVPIGVKELDKVEGWPDTEASLVFRDRAATYTGTAVGRVVDAGAIPLGLTTASEFGGLNVSVSRLNGITHNPWGEARTAGGSSGGSAAAVAGGLVPVATGGDGGGSIRIPAGFCGLLGLKCTYGRFPRGPHAGIYPLTAVWGCLARSVRDAARWSDVANGHHARDPYSLPKVSGWEAGLGSMDLSGLRMAVVPDLNKAIIRPEIGDLVSHHAGLAASELGLTLVDVQVDAPDLGLEWAMANIAADLLKELGDRWPDCRDELTEALATGIEICAEIYDHSMATRVEQRRAALNEQFADVFEQTDLLVCATNPDVAYPARVTANTRVGETKVGLENNGLLTVPANMTGQPAVSIPVGLLDGLPVGMQVIGRHHQEPMLLELAAHIERERPWPLVAPSSPR